MGCFSSKRADSKASRVSRWRSTGIVALRDSKLKILQPPTSNTSQDGMVVRVEEPAARKEGSQSRKCLVNGVLKGPKAKNPKESSPMVQRVKTPKKSMELVINGIDMDISCIPIPVYSCTRTPKQFYRWGCGGWQSPCCTTNVCTYPLPMNTNRRGSRIVGRKMSKGALKKVLEKLAAESYNFANAIDLKNYWAKHGTNRFVTISFGNAVGQLVRLERLSISRNMLTYLPETIGSLRNGWTMTLWDNFSEDIPSSVCNLLHLKSLCLDNNNVNQIPSNLLKDCKALQNISLHGNPISADQFQQTDGFDEFEARGKKKFYRQIDSHVMISSKGLDGGVDM